MSLDGRFAQMQSTCDLLIACTTCYLGQYLQYSFLAGVAAGIIYIIIALFTGTKLGSEAISVGLMTAVISFVIALVFFSSFILYFSRKKAS